jgi:hypothetical protein
MSAAFGPQRHEKRIGDRSGERRAPRIWSFEYSTGCGTDVMQKEGRTPDGGIPVTTLNR